MDVDKDPLMKDVLSLDDLYYMTARIYSEQNAERPPTATLAHFVEVCGMLATYDRRKKRENFSMEDALCKALGWFFPLLAKVGIASVEELIYRKYPYACPYCRLCPHKDDICKTVRGTQSTLDHTALKQVYISNEERRPSSLTDWQQMFQDIYPRSVSDAKGRSTLGLLEELGELAEAVRVFELHPKYLAGEAADVFSYLMGLANEHAMHAAIDEERVFSLENEFLKRYPGMCAQCGNEICCCPTIPDATVGRMAKELNVEPDDQLFLLQKSVLREKGRIARKSVLRKLRAEEGESPEFPFDRGEANAALVEFIHVLSRAAGGKVEDQLEDVARKAEQGVASPGTAGRSEGVSQALKQLRKLYPALSEVWAKAIAGKEDFPALVGRLLPRLRVLLVAAGPSDTRRLHLDRELKGIRDAVGRSKYRDMINFTSLPAATTDDLRRELLRGEFEIVHFSGHGDAGGPLFANEINQSYRAPLTAVGALIRRYPTIQCVVLNACWSLAELDDNDAFAPYVIGMDAQIDDEAAAEFARGFYDALGAGRGYEFAITEGKDCAALKGLEVPLKVLKRSDAELAW